MRLNQGFVISISLDRLVGWLQSSRQYTVVIYLCDAKIIKQGIINSMVGHLLDQLGDPKIRP